ncbi:MAG: DEAD/DEAH box helicase family protein [Oscillospiraceae bacterium]|jgi:superfamily II DNA or RNA helicase|nr:DEAD/DEAH box helicase family protein [Oscillospiraceae bacterium]
MADSNYEHLLAELAALRSENERLKAGLSGSFSTEELTQEQALPASDALSAAPCEQDPAPGGGITQKSSVMEKVALFMELFHGREDVYAKHWHSEKRGTSGYSPVCLNEWSPGVCDKKRYKCAVCPHRRFAPPDSSAVFRHLSGKSRTGADIMALYPLTADENCHFLAIEFGDESWRDDVTAFRAVCTDFTLFPAVERVNANSAHVWFFFAEKIRAVLARRFGNALLTAAMNRRHEIPFGVYDRLFPNSDAAPRGYFGSPIPLPLQGRARKSGDGVFVDDNHAQCADQWHFLSQIKKLDISHIDNVIRQLSGNTELGELAAYEDDDEREPWKLASRQEPLSSMDFLENVNIVKANMLHICKDGISQTALNRLRRLGAFRNPEYAKAERMRLPARDFPRIIDCTREGQEYLSLPRGCEEGLQALLDSAGVQINIDDKRNFGAKIHVDFNGELRPEQLPAAKAILRHEIGVLSATTAFGKTVLGAYMIAQRKVNTLILVHTTALLQQWKKALEQFLTIREILPDELDKRGRKKAVSTIGRLGAGKNELRGIVDIAIIQSLVSGDEVRDLVQNYGLVIVDECHHVSAVSFEKILRKVNAKYIYGLTATPMRQDGLQPIIFMQCGAIRYRVNPNEQAAKLGFARFVVPRFTSFSPPPNFDGKDLTISSLYSQIAEDTARNALIVKDVKYTLKKGRTPLVLTKLISQVNALTAELDCLCPHVISLTGKATAKEKRAAMERLKSIPEGEQLVIVATGQFVGEGFDEPRLDTLFLASPISWHGTLQQYAGRLHRTYPGKESVIIFDYADISVRMFEAMFHKRIKGYSQMGYRAAMPGSAPEKQGSIFNSAEYRPLFTRDIYDAKREIVFTAPKINRNQVESMLKILSSARINGVTIAIITSPAASYKPEQQELAAALIAYLRECGIHVQEKPRIHQNCAVIDRKIVWYGNMNLLGYNHAETSIMRFENPDVAAELLK